MILAALSIFLDSINAELLFSMTPCSFLGLEFVGSESGLR